MPAVKEIKSLKDLTPDPNNANLGTQRGLGMLDASLRELGAGRSILADKNGVVIAGNKTLERAMELGLPIESVHTQGDRLIVVVRDDLDLERDDSAKRLAIADNRIAEIDLAWNVDVLKTFNDDGLLDKLWNDKELQELLDQAAGGGDTPEPQIDKADELQKIWQVERGQIWEIGSHRLMCGDATSQDDINALMGGDTARLTWTDPPYGVDYGGKKQHITPGSNFRERQIKNDNLSPAELESFLRSALTNASSVSVPGAAIYVACPQGTLIPFLIAAFTDSGFDFKWGLVWLKDRIVLSRADYHFKHENILYGWKPGATHYFTTDRTQSSVFEYPRPTKSDEHPTMKPVELVAHMIRNSSEQGDIVLDIFGGSGSTMVASEKERRACRMMELLPPYCAVVLQRMADAGLNPRRAT